MSAMVDEREGMHEFLGCTCWGCQWARAMRVTIAENIQNINQVYVGDHKELCKYIVP